MGGINTGILGAGYSPTTTENPAGVSGGAIAPGSIGADPVPLGTQRIIAQVKKDWDPPNPSHTPEIVVRGATLADAGRELDRLDEWGQAGGSLRADAIPAGTSTDLTVSLHGNLVHRLPSWTGRDTASAAAKAEWDRMLGKLRAHEDRHLAIVVEEGDRLASDLIGLEISEIARMVTEANKRMRNRQIQLDADTEHGSKAGVQYGDVTLDTSIQ